VRGHFFLFSSIALLTCKHCCSDFSARLRGKIQITDQKEERKIPVYRLPAGLKRQAIYEANLPDENANATAKAVTFESTNIDSPASYSERMVKKQVTTKTLLTTHEEYSSDMIAAGGTLKHKFFADNDAKIVTGEGKTFAKNLQQVFPPEFTAWISGKFLYLFFYPSFSDNFFPFLSLMYKLPE
jgi:hypothetical protein